MRAMLLVVVFASFCSQVAGQELPRKELDDAIKAAKDAKIQELTAEVKTVQKAIAAGGKGYGDNRREAIINARKKLAEVEAALDAAKKASPVPELDVEKLAVGQVGKLYRNQVTRDSISVPNGSGGSTRVATAYVYKIPVEAEVAQIMDANGVLVEAGDKTFWVRMSSNGVTTGQKVSLDKPVKVVGTKSHSGGSVTVFELAFFAP